MEVFRLVREKYALPLSVKGAAIKGGRRNSIGFDLIYTAQNRSLALVDFAAHFSLTTLPEDYVMLTIFIPGGLSYSKVFEDNLAEGWKDFPHPVFTQNIGDRLFQWVLIVYCTHPLLSPGAISTS